MSDINPGSSVIITDAEGKEWPTTALSEVKQGYAFPVVWVNRPLASGEYEPTPWPAESVRTA